MQQLRLWRKTPLTNEGNSTVTTKLQQRPSESIAISSRNKGKQIMSECDKRKVDTRGKTKRLSAPSASKGPAHKGESAAIKVRSRQRA